MLYKNTVHFDNIQPVETRQPANTVVNEVHIKIVFSQIENMQLHTPSHTYRLKLLCNTARKVYLDQTGKCKDIYHSEYCHLTLTICFMLCT